MSLVGRETLVAPDDTWSLLMVMCVAVAISIYLEQKYMWASKISGAIIALLFALVLSNLSIIPTACTLYDDIIWGFAVPMGIPLLMLQCNMKKILERDRTDHDHLLYRFRRNSCRCISCICPASQLYSRTCRCGSDHDRFLYRRRRELCSSGNRI